MLEMIISRLAGSSYHTTRGLGGMSVSGFYNYLHAVMDAICDVANRLPEQSKERVLELADDFTAISKDGIMTGCYGLNVHAISDSLRRFTGYCFNSPGKVGDSIAYKKKELNKDIVNLPMGFYYWGQRVPAVRFAACVVYEIKHSDFNSFLRQLRIRNEMAFGLLTNAWSISSVH
ncbi:LOW QUALITY PROTEIN: hypothetical protein PHMEG_0001797 [Phytophthora megakarya]|uniref:Uncharacterized protein n=1 Tax=Phytophthora megakarya TaxID=4795 RepID=A0A225X0Y8_9STRA|nr:LOW QUALITY PROTEIN: hypothetical protein PHMEG_0001797 [Phytophthora megakarya]